MSTGIIQLLASFEFSYDGYRDPRRPQWLYWLPDNRRIILLRQYTGGPEYAIFSVDIEKGKIEQLNERIVSVDTPSLTPDGKSLLFSTSLDLNELMLSNGEVHNLTAVLDEDVFTQALASDGTIIALNTYDHREVIVLMDMNRKVLSRLRQLPAFDAFVWRPICP